MKFEKKIVYSLQFHEVAEGVYLVEHEGKGSPQRYFVSRKEIDPNSFESYESAIQKLDASPDHDGYKAIDYAWPTPGVRKYGIPKPEALEMYRNGDMMGALKKFGYDLYEDPKAYLEENEFDPSRLVWFCVAAYKCHPFDETYPIPHATIHVYDTPYDSTQWDREARDAYLEGHELVTKLEPVDADDVLYGRTRWCFKVADDVFLKYWDYDEEDWYDDKHIEYSIKYPYKDCIDFFGLAQFRLDNDDDVEEDCDY